MVLMWEEEIIEKGLEEKIYREGAGLGDKLIN